MAGIICYDFSIYHRRKELAIVSQPRGSTNSIFGDKFLFYRDQVCHPHRACVTIEITATNTKKKLMVVQEKKVIKLYAL